MQQTPEKKSFKQTEEASKPRRNAAWEQPRSERLEYKAEQEGVRGTRRSLSVSRPEPGWVPQGGLSALLS